MPSKKTPAAEGSFVGVPAASRGIILTFFPLEAEDFIDPLSLALLEDPLSSSVALAETDHHRHQAVRLSLFSFWKKKKKKKRELISGLDV
jgi:hypothetical protein